MLLLSFLIIIPLRPCCTRTSDGRRRWSQGCSRDALEILPRYSRDTPEILPGCSAFQLVLMVLILLPAIILRMAILALILICILTPTRLLILMVILEGHTYASACTHRREEEEAMERRILDIREEVLGAKHPRSYTYGYTGGYTCGCTCGCTCGDTCGYTWGHACFHTCHHVELLGAKHPMSCTCGYACGYTGGDTGGYTCGRACHQVEVLGAKHPRYYT